MKDRIMVLELKEDCPESIKQVFLSSMETLKGVVTDNASRALARLQTMTDGVALGHVSSWVVPYFSYNRDFSLSFCNKLFELGFFSKKDEQGNLVVVNTAQGIDEMSQDELVYPNASMGADAAVIFGEWIEPRFMSDEEAAESRKNKSENFQEFLRKAMASAGVENKCDDQQCPCHSDDGGKAEPVEPKDGVALQS